jgi:hypothetical protein
MPNKTDAVLVLVRDVLRTFSESYGEDVIEDVCLAIENNSDWRRRYDELCEELSQDVVNNWIGRYVKDITGLRTVREVNARRSHIITEYTKLTS